MIETDRLDALRRRVQSDPASIAFAQLGEELRRAGLFSEAVDTCRAGLARHPAYLSARVTLARALVELERLGDAREEFELVLRSASDNLAAMRGLGDIYAREGGLEQALEHYRSALDVAPNDPELEATVADLEQRVESIRQQPEAEAVATVTPAPEVAVSFESGESGPVDPDRDAALRTVAALEGWLAAINVARADRRA